MKATFERVDKIGEKKVTFGALNGGDWFKWPDENDPIMVTGSRVAYLDGGWDDRKIFESDCEVTPIKVHIQYEVL